MSEQEQPTPPEPDQPASEPEPSDTVSTPVEDDTLEPPSEPDGDDRDVGVPEE